MSAIVIGFTQNITPAGKRVIPEMPLGITFVGATDDGTTATIFYLQSDDAEPLTKPVTLEFVPPYIPFADEGRSLIAFLSNGWLLFENTEATVPDRQIRNP